MNKLDLLKYDPHVGKQLITFSEGVWDDALAGVKVKASHWLVASNRPGEYGAIGGGMKNLECFIGWLFNSHSYAYNPVTIRDYQWSSVNNAFMRPNCPMFKIPVKYKCLYVFCRENGRLGAYTKIYETNSIFQQELLWEAKQTNKLCLEVPDGDYCWNPDTSKICRFFNNNDGIGKCIVFFRDLDRNKQGRFIRPKCCADKLLK